MQDRRRYWPDLIRNPSRKFRQIRRENRLARCMRPTASVRSTKIVAKLRSNTQLRNFVFHTGEVVIERMKSKNPYLVALLDQSYRGCHHLPFASVAGEIGNNHQN